MDSTKANEQLFNPVENEVRAEKNAVDTEKPPPEGQNGSLGLEVVLTSL